MAHRGLEYLGLSDPNYQRLFYCLGTRKNPVPNKSILFVICFYYFMDFKIPGV